MNRLYYGDNLDILRSMAEYSVDLIYLDPPFNSKANYNVLFREPDGLPSEAQITAFEDTWHWTNETENEYSEIVGIAPPAVVEMISSFRKFIKENDMMAYLTRMCVRVLELHRVLKNTGTIYLHCDPTAGHYLKILLDTIFGSKNFRNEIVWCYRGAGYPKHDFGRRHDLVFRYSKTSEYTFNLDDVRDEYAQATKERFKHHIGNVRKGKDFGTQALHPKGKQPDDWWPIQPIAPSARDRLGYPTQKPEPLLEKIILASSNKGDVVLDPFCGCGTTIAVAHKLNRKWIGIDITHLAINLIKWRLKSSLNAEPPKDYQVLGEPRDLAGARELASGNRYQFQWWALSLIQAKPYGNKKKGADTGIDGYIFFFEDAQKVNRAIVQVKSGGVSVRDIRDLAGVIDREESPIGVFITLESPTRPMTKEAASKGYYTSEFFKGKFPRIQILTIEQLLAGGALKLPPTASFYKQAGKIAQDNQVTLKY